MNRTNYPAVRLCVLYGNRIALLISALIALAGILVFAMGSPLGLTAVPLSLLLYGILRLLSELVHIISTTLLPE
jgi:hypothetical protein